MTQTKNALLEKKKVVCKWIKELDENTAEESERVDFDEREFKNDLKTLMEAVQVNEENAQYVANKATKKSKKSKKSPK